MAEFNRLFQPGTGYVSAGISKEEAVLIRQPLLIFYEQFIRREYLEVYLGVKGGKV